MQVRHCTKNGKLLFSNINPLITSSAAMCYTLSGDYLVFLVALIILSVYPFIFLSALIVLSFLFFHFF